MSGHHDGRQEAAMSPLAASAATHVIGPTIQRKPIAPSSVQSGAPLSGSAMPQHSLSVSSAGQDGYTVSPASSIHRDRESHTAEHQEVLSPVSQGYQSSPGRIPSAAVSSYPRQWQQIEVSSGHRNEPEQQANFQGFAGTEVGPGQPELLPPLQRQSVIQWPELTRSSWIFPRAGDMHRQSGEHSTIAQPESQRRPSDLQLELAEARAREALSGRGPRIVSYGPAPPAEDHGLAPTTFTLPVLHPPAAQSHETLTVPWQAAAPNVEGLNTAPGKIQDTLRHAQDAAVDNGNGGETTNKKTKLDKTHDRKQSPFMHYEDIDYFGPEPEETDLDSPDLEVEQEKLKFAEAQLGSGGAERITSRGKGKLHQPRTAVAEVGSAITPAPATASASSPRATETSSGTVGYFLPSVSGTAPADVLQMGIKARKSWERQQRRQAKKHHHQQHLEQPSSHLATTIATTKPLNMIMRIPSLISSAGRGGGNSVAGGGSNDYSSRNGEGGLNSNNPYYAQDYSTSEPHRNGGVLSSHSNRNRDSNGYQHADIAPQKAMEVDSLPPKQGVLYPWAPEILWSLLSLATLVAIFLTLRAFDGKSIDPMYWPISPKVTLNTLIAFLTSICQLALLIPITQGLAQLKWNWFARAAPGGTPRQGRPLDDFVLLNDAAFGTGTWGGWPLAALKLLLSGKGRTLGVSACIVLLTCFLSSPFTQGAVGYQNMLVPAQGNDIAAAVARSEVFFLSSSSRDNIEKRETSSVSSNRYQDLVASQKRAIQHGIHYYTHSTSGVNDNNPPAIPLLPPIPPECSTPSCQFPLFSSLAVCVDTADVSSRLSISSLSTTSSKTPLATAFSVLGFMPDSGTASLRNASLANGAYLLGSTGTCNLNISSPASAGVLGSRRAGMQDNILKTENTTTTLAFTDQSDKLSAAIANFFVIYTNQTSRGNDEEAAFSAVEVLVHFCVNTYNVSVTEGVTTTEVVDSSTSVAQITTTGDSEEGTRILHLADPLSSGSSNGTMSVNLTATRVLQNQLVSLIKGTYSAAYGDLMQGLTPASEVLGAALFDTGFLSSARAIDNHTSSGGEGGEQQQQQQQQHKTIGNLMLNVATSLTNTIRASSAGSSSSTSAPSSSRPLRQRQTTTTTTTTTSSSSSSSREEARNVEAVSGPEPSTSTSTTAVKGTPLLSQKAIKIHYPPMTFLTTQVFLSIAFLTGIIIQTAVWGVPVLKGSSMDALLAIGPRERAVLQEEEDMGKRGRRMRLRLVSSPSDAEPGEQRPGSGAGWYLDTDDTPDTHPTTTTRTEVAVVAGENVRD